MLVSATILKFSTGSSNGSTMSLGSSSSQSGSGCSGNILTLNPMPWECDKFSPVKLESPDTNLDDIVLDQSASSDFAELKPLPYDDYGSATALTGGMDPVLSAHNNNNNNNHNKCLGSPSSSLQYSSSCSQSDVTSSGSPTSPPGSNMAAKIDALDFNKNDLDDLASIVGISIDADSTVPNGGTGDCNDIADLDWIDTIKPLNCELSLDSLMNSNHPMMNGMNGHHLLLQRNNSIINNPVINGQNYLQMVPLGSTLQTLLQGSNSQQMPKITQLQQRPSPQAPPPPYSILQSRLQHGPLAPPPSSMVSHVIKVDSTYDLLKSQESMNNGYLSSSYGSSSDSLPHSTQTQPVNQVSTSDQGLQRRLNELGGLTKIKKKHGGSGNRPKLSSMSGGSGSGNGAGSPGDKKMMHHCNICNRGFLNKSNIKVHMRTHTGEKPFKCEHCSKAFRQKAHLLKHMSIHKRISRD